PGQGPAQAPEVPADVIRDRVLVGARFKEPFGSFLEEQGLSLVLGLNGRRPRRLFALGWGEPRLMSRAGKAYLFAPECEHAAGFLNRGILAERNFSLVRL